MASKHNERRRKRFHQRRKANNEKRAIEYRASNDQNKILSSTYDRLQPYLGDIQAHNLTAGADWFLPGYGAAATGEDSLDILREADSFGDYALGAGMGALALAEAVPLVGKAAKPAAKALKGGMKNAAPDVMRFMADESGAVGGKIKRSTDLPILRGKDVDEAIEIARREPHLIPSGAGSEGKYVGGPRNVKSKQGLNKVRRQADEAVARGAAGGDWYDRYRAGVTEVTGGNPVDNDWMTAQQGQYSAGVSPEGELNFTLKDLNSNMATGESKRSRFGAQSNATNLAMEARDPSLFQLGDKTGEYARRVNPRAADERTATGVNDFRHARTLGFTEASGKPQEGAIGAASHRWSDYETALMVDRANKSNLAGRSDWTGEQIQAAPWVAQKADDLYSREAKSFTKEARGILAARGIDSPSPEMLEETAKQVAFDKANRTIADYFPKHTAYGTYESQPFVGADHLPGLAGASDAEKLDFHNAAPWTDETGRDMIYSGIREPGTGLAVRTRPSVEMQGTYTPDGGVLETNPGTAARPLVSFDAGATKHTMPADDAAIMDLSEATRAYVDVQGAGAWHKPFGKANTGDRNAARLTFPEQAPRTLEELEMLKEVGSKYELPDVIDTGDGVTFANFSNDNKPKMGAKDLTAFGEDLTAGGYNAGELIPGRMDSGYLGYEDAWKAGEGSGAATARLFENIDAAPAALVEKMNANPAIGQKAAANLARDADAAAKYGATRADIQRAQEIISEGPGWIDRLRQAVARGELLPAVLVPILGPALNGGGGDRPLGKTEEIPLLSGSI